MSKGRKNKIVGQIGEFLTCAKLGKLGLFATPFSGNVPHFDILVADEKLRTLPIQVKSSMSPSWPSQANHWMNIEFDIINQNQKFIGLKKITNEDLIYVNVLISNKEKDRFFVFTKKDLQHSISEGYRNWMDSKGWKRPRNWMSLDSRYGVDAIAKFEDNWDLIFEMLNKNESHYYSS